MDKMEFPKLIKNWNSVYIKSYSYVSSMVVWGGGWLKFVRISFSIQCFDREVFLSLEAVATQEQSWYTVFFFFFPELKDSKMFVSLFLYPKPRFQI